MISIKNQPTLGADMRSHVNVLGDEFLTATALLARVVGVHKHHLPSGAFSLGDTVGLELSPASIENRQIQASFSASPLGQIRAVLLRVRFRVRSGTHIGDPEVFKD